MIWRTIFIFTLLSLVSCSTRYFALRNNDRIVFFGDSITQLGVRPNGYITLIKDSLSKKLPSIEIIGAGIAGNKVPDLQARIDSDVIAKDPTIVVIYIGINDVWHSIIPGRVGTPKDRYEAGLVEIIGKIQKTGARVILCTLTVIGEKKNGKNQLDKQLDEYSGISRRVAQKTKIELCDLRNAFVSYLKLHNPRNVEKGILTVDKAHLSDKGNRLVATELLKALKQ
ncbi:MAG: GDSL-type esterase/lipase family protein [Bacteroidota bacterium]|jgi:lysophospholipase L1-like esterase